MPEYVPELEDDSEPSMISIFRPVPVSPPQLVRNPASSNETVTSSDDVSLEDDTAKGENLDTVAYVRASANGVHC